MVSIGHSWVGDSRLDEHHDGACRIVEDFHSRCIARPVIEESNECWGQMMVEARPHARQVLRKMLKIESMDLGGCSVQSGDSKIAACFR